MRTEVMSHNAQKKSLLPPSLADIIFICILFALALLRGKGLLLDADTGYHVRAGEYILKTFSVPTHDIFSFLTPPLPWTAHEWLSEVIMALLHGFHGLTAVVLFFAFLIAISFALLFRILQTEGSNVLVNVAIILLIITSSEIHWLARPHIFTLFLLIIWYFILDQYQYHGRNYLYLLPLIMLLWVNLHGGFMAGFILIGVYLVGNALHLFASDAAGRKETRRKLRDYGIVLLFCLFASLVNPRGVHILLFPFALTSNSYIMNNVVEFLSPNFHDAMPFKYLLLLTIVLFAVSKKRPNSIEILLVLLFTYMSLYSARYIPLFAVIVAPILSAEASEIVNRANGKFADFFRQRSARIAAVDASSKGHLWPLAAVLLVVILTARGNISFAFDKTIKPVVAVDFLKQEHIGGHMYDNDEFGDYIIYAGWPEYHVFFDGRSDMYGAARMRDYLKVARVQRGWEDVLNKYHIDWIIYDAGSPLSLLLEGRSDWKLIYADKVAEIFVRNIPRYAQLIAKYPDVRPVVEEEEKKNDDG